MWKRIRETFEPPVFDEDEEKTIKARLLHHLLLIILSGSILFPIISLLFGTLIEPEVIVLVIVFLITAVFLYILVRKGFVQQASIVLGGVWWILFTFGAYTFGGLHDTSITGFFFLIILIGVISGWRALIAFASLSGLSLISIYVAEHQRIIDPIIYVPSDAADLTMPLVLIGVSTLVLRVAISTLTNAYENARENTARLKSVNAELQLNEFQLKQRTQDLERRNKYLEATAAVAHNVASELDPDILLNRVVNLVTEQFEFYHTGVFLLEPGDQYIAIKAASSIGGQKMLALGHRLRVGEEGIVGFVAQHGHSRVALDTDTDAEFIKNPNLLETRSEAALPLIVRGQIIGVLDVQSKQPDAFNEEDIIVLEVMADQIAVTFQNANLFRQVEINLEAQRRAYQETSKKAWERLSSEKRNSGYQYIRGEIFPITETSQELTSNLPEVTIPLEVGNQIIGHITAHKSEEYEDWSSDDLAILRNLSSQLSIALESARLYKDTQIQAERERLTHEITDRLHRSLDMDTLMQTLLKEISSALGVSEAFVQLKSMDDLTKDTTN